jgi:hypothetical protein
LEKVRKFSQDGLFHRKVYLSVDVADQDMEDCRNPHGVMDFFVQNDYLDREILR